MGEGCGCHGTWRQLLQILASRDRLALLRFSRTVERKLRDPRLENGGLLETNGASSLELLAR